MKRLFAAMMSAIMVLSLCACGDSSSKKGSNPNLGCELSDYLFMESKDKMDKFIEDNELQYDEENGDYYNHYITITLSEDGTTIEMATIMNQSKYTMFGISVGEEFDRDIVSARLNRNRIPLFSDEGDYIYYGSSGVAYEDEALAIRLEEDGTVGFVVYTSKGLNYIASFAGDTTDMNAMEIYTNFANQLNSDISIFTGSFTDKAMIFIDNHQDMFIDNEFSEDYSNYMGSEYFSYKKYIKSPDGYPTTLMCDYDMYVYDISETDISDGMSLTEGVIGSGITSDSYGVFYFIMPGSIEVYSGDYVNVVGLPLGCGTFENAVGEVTECVFLAVVYMTLADNMDVEYAYDYGY